MTGDTGQLLHGVHRDQEHRKEEFLRDVAPLSKRMCSALMRREGYVLALCMAAFAMILYPQTMLLGMPLALFLHLARVKSLARDHLPMRLPETSGKVDYGDVLAQGGWHRARGSFFLGNEMDTGRELWIGRGDALTHMLVLGTTGAGKTETLVSLAFNYLAKGSGLTYVDPKAAPRLAAQIYTMCRIMGRDDDFLLLSYMADKKAQEAMRLKGHMRTPLRQSNTQNPFAHGTATAQPTS